MKDRTVAAAVMFTTASALAILCVRGVFLRWFSDDFWVAAAVATRGFWGGQAEWYRIGSGRFTFTFAEAVLATIGPWTLALLVPLTTLAMVAALGIRLRWPLALAMAWAILLGISDVPQSILWETGLLSYAAPLAAFAWWIGNAAGREKWRWLDVAVPLAAGGCSETEVLAQIVICGIAFAAWRRKPLLAGFIGSLICLAVMIPSPGNAIRRGLYPTPLLPHVISATAVDAASFFTDAFTRSGLVLLLVFLAAALFAPRLPRRVAIVAALCTIVCAFVTCAACEATLGVMLPLRARMITYALLVASVAAFAAAIPRLEERRRAALAVALTILAVLPVITAVQLAREIPEARTFVRRWDRIHAVFRANRGRNVIVDNAPGVVGTLPFIYHEPADNVTMARTFGLKSVAAAPLPRKGRFGALPNDAVRCRWD